jgi:hypothetical protein
MTSRADYTNALVQAVAQQELAKQTDPLADEMALPRRRPTFTHTPFVPSYDEIKTTFSPPTTLGPATDQDMGLGQTVNPDVLPVEALTPEPEPAGIAQWVKDAMGDLFSRKQTPRGAKIETIMRLMGAEDERMFMGMTDEELDRAIINIRSDFEQGGYQHIPARRAE